MKWLLYVLIVTGYWVTSALGQACSLVWSDAIRNKVIISRHTAIAGVFTEQECMDACVAYTPFPCLSIEYQRKKKKCQLSQVRRDQVPANQFRRARGFLYRERVEGNCPVVDVCDSNPCQHGGECCLDRNPSGGYRCFECDAGWGGNYCETDINECASNPCQHGGTCVDGVNQYTCSACNDGWQGVQCETDVDECASIPCPSGAVCQDRENGYGCYIGGCADGYSGAACDIKTADAVDCNSYYEQGIRTNGVYTITPTGSAPFTVYCELNGATAWTFIQHRTEGAVDFRKTWAEYKSGFGSPSGEHWLGNDKIHLLSSQAQYELKMEAITVEPVAGEYVYAVYDQFSIGDEASLYRLDLGVMTAADSATTTSAGLGYFFDHNRGMAFTTPDSDHDLATDVNCGVMLGGGWWHNNCAHTCLNCAYPTVSCAQNPTTCIMWRALTYVIQTAMKVTRT